MHNAKLECHFILQYDASSMSKIGGGGEYEIQIGFGWTNGVVLDFLTTYNARLSSSSSSSSDDSNSSSSASPEPVVREP